jgi:hypothetical protein
MLSFNFDEGFQNRMLYIPSPAEVSYKILYSIEMNLSGRLQYFRQPVNEKRKRITKTEFSIAYNHSRILAIQPVQSKTDRQHFLLKFFTH